jgi:hypothetical protein
VTKALNRGFSIPTVAAPGGWKTERMMKGYGALTDATFRAAAKAVAFGETPMLACPLVGRHA